MTTAIVQKEAMLQVEGLVAGYLRGVDILKGVSIHVADAEIVTVVGPNGAGKSTLMKAIVGLVPHVQGMVALSGGRLEGLFPYQVARMGLGYVPQRANVFPTMTVEENLELPLLSRSRRERRARLEALYQTFPRLAERRRLAAGVTSGGERQMIAIARALAPEPQVLLLDEPTAGLSPAMVADTFETIQSINRSGVTVLMVEQNARAALAVSHRGYVLDLGRNRLEGSGRDLLEDPAVVELYLGGGNDAQSVSCA